MNFQHTDDRRMLSDSLNRFVREKVDFGVRQRAAASSEGGSRSTWAGLVELGALAAMFTEDQGGMGGTGFDIAVVFEALGRGLVVEPFAGALMAGQALAASASASEAARAELDALIAGEQMALLAHEEADTGADPSRVSVRAARSAEGWRLSGTKVNVHQAEMADTYVLSARTSGQVGDTAGISLFLVPANVPNLVRRGHAQVDGGRGADLILDDVSLPESALLGAEGQSFAALERAVGCGLLALAAESLGAMEVAKDQTLEYLRTRKQFGVPIGSFQALQHRMADLLLDVTQARSAVINAAAALDNDARLVRERALSAGKYTVGRAGTKMAEECIQLHGGIGMTWELPLAHYAKRLVLIDHQLGDEDQHLQRYITLSLVNRN
ncbi:acyl-CoA dehydrogenase [uncultured Sphaerotilus sp.]|uniref:acyl-CoA dehydrogenase family protein n=1 Tax=uncultured Sphaerotilus sp. TaxID=474984 RepID=UPI0030CA1DF8